ncbi:PREDICTED: early nodulin-like protein 2 [Nelumbo nucifera]|uniref:Early nodulin-like protein 2 n=2 Tax=Nelumbo nucifera TaxID=4432 RepID=A0A1U8AXP5_NELNU|nr:PREDICTED: early nodulin-like protein 2 [Nelumbo nucifera]DAD33112.1 TPA_asm: hypothetical protein HUJ06_011963 [Nelumbo nucifera]
MIPLSLLPEANKVCNLMIFSCLTSFVFLAVVSVSAYQFQVGGERGWVKPTGNETESYDEWAARNRFHVGDSVYFKYQNDSVLVVNDIDYRDCNSSKPISKFDDGNTVYRLDRYGFFYFVSGVPGHCRSGQRLVIRVMVQNDGMEPPESAPPPRAGGGGVGINGSGSGSFELGPPTPNATARLSFTSYFMTALGGVVVILYLFM